jgi:polyamine oxidase
MSNYYAVFDPDGHNADPAGTLRHWANTALDCLNRTSSTDHNTTESARERLVKCGWSPETDIEWAMDWMMTVDDPGEPARLTHRYFPDETYMWWGPDDWFVVDQHPRGFARLIDGMVRDSVPPGDARVVFNARVAKMEWGCDGVTASTKDGRTFKSKYAISTVSLGVLQHHHQELFSPPLPKKHAEALSHDHVVMGNLSHVLVQFPTVWWDNSLPRWISANHGGQKMSGEFTEWQNLNHDSLVPGSHTLLSFLGDPESSKYEAMQDADVMAAVVKRLRIQNPGKDIPDAVAVFISRWGFDDKFYGSYSHHEPGWKYKFQKVLTTPLKACGKDVIRFAGEAMCDNLNGYTHGGYQTGKESAARYLYGVGKGPDPDNDDQLSLCNW